MKKIGWSILALISCPCHLVFIIPVFAGTGLGSYMANHNTLVSVSFGILFVISMGMMITRVYSQEKPVASQDCCRIPERR